MQSRVCIKRVTNGGRVNVFLKLKETLDIFSYILNVSIGTKTFSCVKYN
jgi:hypothetical protein